MSGRKTTVKQAWKPPKNHAGPSGKSAHHSRIEIGKHNRLTVQARSDFGLYLGTEDDRVLLPGKYVSKPLAVGDAVDVFVYTDSKDRPVATLLNPAGEVGDFVFLVAKNVAPFGAFMDWGLEKDLLVPKNAQQNRMEPGKKYLVKICQDDRTHRVYGTTQIPGNCDKDIGHLKLGQQVDILIHTLSPIGVTAVVNNRYYGRMASKESFQKLFIGDACKGFITRIRSDGKLELGMKKPGHSSVPKSASVILYRLNTSGGFIPCNDKSSPEEIRKRFSMSKKEFKRAVGNLYKKRLIELKDNGIGLVK